MVVRLKSAEAAKCLSRCKAMAVERKEKGESDKAVLNALEQLSTYDGELDVSVATLRAGLVIYTSIVDPSNPEAANRRFWEEVMHDSKPAFPEYEKRKQETEQRLKDKEEWRRSLRVKDQQRRYNNMVGNVAWGGPKDQDMETRGMYQTSMGLNMVAAAATVGFVLYYCMKGVFPQESIRVLVATLGGFAMMMIELVLYIIRSYEVQEYEAKRIRNEMLGRAGKSLPIPPPEPLFTSDWWWSKKADTDKDKIKEE